MNKMNKTPTRCQRTAPIGWPAERAARLRAEGVGSALPAAVAARRLAAPPAPVFEPSRNFCSCSPACQLSAVLGLEAYFRAPSTYLFYVLCTRSPWAAGG